MIRKFLKQKAYPTFDCEDCIGMKDHGCQCAAYEAIAPNTPPTKFHTFLRWILSLSKKEGRPKG
jgi:hypothetical protein